MKLERLLHKALIVGTILLAHGSLFPMNGDWKALFRTYIPQFSVIETLEAQPESHGVMSCLNNGWFPRDRYRTYYRPLAVLAQEYHLVDLFKKDRTKALCILADICQWVWDTYDGIAPKCHSEDVLQGWDPEAFLAAEEPFRIDLEERIKKSFKEQYQDSCYVLKNHATSCLISRKVAEFFPFLKRCASMKEGKTGIIELCPHDSFKSSSIEFFRFLLSALSLRYQRLHHDTYVSSNDSISHEEIVLFSKEQNKVDFLCSYGAHDTMKQIEALIRSCMDGQIDLIEVMALAHMFDVRSIMQAIFCITDVRIPLEYFSVLALNTKNQSTLFRLLESEIQRLHMEYTFSYINIPEREKLLFLEALGCIGDVGAREKTKKNFLRQLIPAADTGDAQKTIPMCTITTKDVITDKEVSFDVAQQILDFIPYGAACKRYKDNNKVKDTNILMIPGSFSSATLELFVKMLHVLYQAAHTDIIGDDDQCPLAFDVVSDDNNEKMMELFIAYLMPVLERIDIDLLGMLALSHEWDVRSLSHALFRIMANHSEIPTLAELLPIQFCAPLLMNKKNNDVLIKLLSVKLAPIVGSSELIEPHQKNIDACFDQLILLMNTDEERARVVADCQRASFWPLLRQRPEIKKVVQANLQKELADLDRGADSVIRLLGIFDDVHHSTTFLNLAYAYGLEQIRNQGNIFTIQVDDLMFDICHWIKVYGATMSDKNEDEILQRFKEYRERCYVLKYEDSSCSIDRDMVNDFPGMHAAFPLLNEQKVLEVQSSIENKEEVANSLIWFKLLLYVLYYEQVGSRDVTLCSNYYYLACKLLYERSYPENDCVLVRLAEIFDIKPLVDMACCSLYDIVGELDGHYRVVLFDFFQSDTSGVVAILDKRTRKVINCIVLPNQKEYKRIRLQKKPYGISIKRGDEIEIITKETLLQSNDGESDKAWQQLVSIKSLVNYGS